MYEILDGFRDMILSVDPSATRYFGRGEGAHTIWTEYELDGLYGDNAMQEYTWRILVERYTCDQDDPIARALMEKLSSTSGVTAQYALRRNNDLEMLYHAWDCEVVRSGPI